jgi:Signal transduction histidine kinase
LTFAAGALGITVVILALYIMFIRRQLHSINRQLAKRLKEHTRQPIRLELLDKELNTLAMQINNSFKAEEHLRLKAIRDEKNFKELIANLSHDLRTPLTAIKGYQQLAEKGGLSDSQRENLRIARKHADELGRLIERFFEYSYLLNAEPELHLERINLTNLVTECLAAAVPALENNRLSVRLTETGSPPVFALADKEMLRRIVHNLIRNAIEHAGGNVEVALEAASDRAVLRFGNPVKPASSPDASRLFDRFYTGDKARAGGTGLGLSIVRLLAEQMGGRADASLKEGWLEIRVELTAPASNAVTEQSKRNSGRLDRLK